jgi:beta-glucosidase
MRITGILLALATFPALFAQAPGNAPFLDPNLPAERRAADLVSRMTLEEKVLQMQNAAPAIPRLGIPAYEWWNEALHGVARAGLATVFPQAIGLAATFDTELMHRIAEAISTEARAKYNEAIRNNDHSRYHGLTFWSPNINIFRDPRWGRGQETYGEDPFLTARMAVAFIKGLQGTDPHYYKVIATAKHYAVHSGPEPSRHSFDVVPSARDLQDTYLPAFRASIVEGKADSVMCAYNRVDGVPACANTDLLQKTLKNEWGFQGYIVSDCGAVSDIYRGHQYKANAAEASAAAVKAGTDLTCGNEYRALVDSVKSGLITEAEVNRSLERLFAARFKLGMFDPADRVPFNKIPYSEVDSADHRKIALEGARKSMVLLKNDGALPLNASVKKIAFIGPAADDPEAMLGNYNGFSARHVTPLEGIQRQWAGKAEVTFAAGAAYTAQTPVFVPSSAFASGVTAEYFDNAEFQGEPKLRRVEPRPLIQPGMSQPGYSARWTGTLRPPVTGDYTFTPRAGFNRTAVRLFLDDKELTEDTAPAGGGRGRPILLHTALEAGKAYAFRMEYRAQQGPANAGVQLLWTPPAAPLLAEAVNAAKAADVVIALVGLNPNLEGEEMPVSVPGFQGGDRTNIELPEAQQKLLEAVIATGRPTIVVLTSGSAVAMNYAAQHANALIETWYNGEETGTALAETLAGLNNPSGRLPVTFYRGVDQLPPFEDYSMKGRTYRYFTGDALYGFGFGLSYSKFQYSGIKSRRTSTGVMVSVNVKNESAVEGDEVVQLYLNGGGEGAPIRSLRGFQRIHLRPGETRSVQFTLQKEELGGKKFRVSVGGGQPVSGIPFTEIAL